MNRDVLSLIFTEWIMEWNRDFYSYYLRTRMVFNPVPYMLICKLVRDLFYRHYEICGNMNLRDRDLHWDAELIGLGRFEKYWYGYYQPFCLACKTGNLEYIKKAKDCLNEASLAYEPNIALSIAIAYKQYEIVDYLIRKVKYVSVGEYKISAAAYACADLQMVKILAEGSEFSIYDVVHIFDLPDLKDISIVSTELTDTREHRRDWFNKIFMLDSIEKWEHFDPNSVTGYDVVKANIDMGSYTLFWYHYFKCGHELPDGDDFWIKEIADAKSTDSGFPKSTDLGKLGNTH